jgi:hypothetical protein
MEFRNEPIYRPILRDAILFSWKQKILWIPALLAGILLTGSVFDVLWRSVNSLGAQASLVGVAIPFWQKAVGTWSHLSISSIIIGSLQTLVVTGFFLLVVFAVFCISVIAQSTVVHAIGLSRRGKEIHLTESLRVGARALWPVVVLNIIAIATLLACRSLIAIALAFALQVSSVLMFSLYLVCFILFTLLAVATFIVQIFALNAMILQGATLAQAITRGIDILRRHWITAAETSAILFLISCGLFALAITGGLILSIPFVICLVISMLIGSKILFLFVTILFLLLYIAFLLTAVGFSVLLQYTTWTSLFRVFGEGGILPKIHRIARAFIHQADIPGA